MWRDRVSMKLIVDNRDQNEFPPSLYAVVSNDDLLIEILRRLPTCSLLRFKFVSKRWLSLITGPVSTLWCSDDPSGLFIQRYIHNSSRVIYDYVPFDIRSPPLNNTTLPFGSHGGYVFPFGFPCEGNVEILHSCNGLLLCRVNFPDTQYYVYNPSIKRFKKLPPPCNYSGFKSDYITTMRLAFDPIKSSYYKIVFAEEKDDDAPGSCYIQIQTYSSETGTWSIFPNRFPRHQFLYFENAIYWNNAFHWIHGPHIHSKLDVEHLAITRIQTPDVLDRMSCCRLFESHGCLLLVSQLTKHTRHLNIYKMSKGYSGWSMKYVVNLEFIMKPLPKVGRLEPAIIGCDDVLCVVLGQKEEDSFLVMDTCEKVVQYKITSKAVRKLYECGSLHRKYYDIYSYRKRCQLFEFFRY